MTPEMNTMTAKQLVSHFNAIAGVTPIGEWKGSKAQLIAKIAEAELAAIPAKATKPAKIRLKGKARAKSDFGPRSQRHNVTDFCKLHNLNAKVLRAKLRKAGYNAPYTNEQLAQALDNGKE